jgi:dnd system-associated protein 4
MANDVFLDQKHSDLVDELCQGDSRVFLNMAYGAVVFALIGYEAGHRVAPSPSQKREVPGGALENADAEAYAYLMAVVERKEDPSCLRPENDKEIWRRFEEYANGGLEILSQWVLESSMSVTDALLQKMYAVIIDLPTPGEPEPPEPFRPRIL